MYDISEVDTKTKLLRYEKIFTVLIKYGFEDLLAHPPLNKFVPQSNVLVPNRNGRKISSFSRAERIRLACEELGTTFIKFAQIASNRPDLLPEDLIYELEKLQDKSSVVPVEDILKVLKSEFSRPINEVLEYFDEHPLATASMAQVHRATLNGGKEVVMKVQRPGIAVNIAADISILKNLVSIVENYFPQYAIYNLGELVKMFEKSISEELDFKKEAKNVLRFQKMFRDNSQVYIPSIYKELSSEKVLCLEYINGYKITDLKSLEKLNITGKDLAIRGIGLYFEQVFDHGFFHADPHPGNIFVLDDGKIVFLDYGMMGSVIESDKLLFANVLLAMYEKDIKGLKKSILKFSGPLSKEREKDLEYDIVNFLESYSDISIENIDGSEVMKGLNSLFYDYKIKIPSNILLLLKALIIIEGVGLKLDPQYDIIKNIGPFVQNLLLKKYNPKKVKNDFLYSIDELAAFLKDLPEDAREILYKVKTGKIHIEFEHKGLEPFYKNSEVVVNRLSFALLLVSLIIGSSIILAADIPPRVYNISLIGLVGFVLSGLFAIRLFFSIWKHGKF
jgi:ubiquinone biosynthesis protein